MTRRRRAWLCRWVLAWGSRAEVWQVRPLFCSPNTSSSSSVLRLDHQPCPLLRPAAAAATTTSGPHGAKSSFSRHTSSSSSSSCSRAMPTLPQLQGVQQQSSSSSRGSSSCGISSSRSPTCCPPAVVERKVGRGRGHGRMFSGVGPGQDACTRVTLSNCPFNGCA